MQENLIEAGKLKAQVDKIKGVKRKEKESDVDKVMKKKGEEVEEKLKKGKKLTTEDLLVIQSVKK